MRGYFTRLAKQSGVEIGARNSKAVAGPLSSAPLGFGAAPLHVETVVLVDSMSPPQAAGLQSSPVESYDSGHVASEGALQPARGDSKTSNENDQAAKQVRAAEVSGAPADKQRAQLSDTNSVEGSSIRSFTLEEASNRGPDVSGAMELEKQSDAKGGVIRIGEHRSSIDRKPSPQPDTFVEAPNTIGRHETSIPRDYVESIREWLTSTPARSDDIQSRSAAEQKLIATPEQADRPSHSNFLDRESGPQSEIQEFSLSIGSISIIVEEPAQQPKQLSNSVHRPDSPSVAAPPRASDAFALSRSYFRGF